MALGGLTTLDPNALSATKLRSSGMTAQEVGYKRKAFEQDLAGKLMADQTKQAAIQQKEKAAQAKVAEWKPEYAAFSHTDAFAALLEEEKKLEAKQYADFKAGIGGNPDDATSEAARERRYRRFELDRKAKASQEAVAYGQKMMDAYRARPFDYADDTEAKVTEYISNPAVMETGKLPDLLEELYDLNKATNEQLGFLKPSMSGNAATLPDGSVNTWTSEKVIPGQVMAGIDMVLQNEHAWKAATRAYENLLVNDPERAAQVAETAKKNNIPMVKAMVFDAMNPVYSYTKYKETQSAPSEAGIGDENKKAAARELLETGFGIVGGAAQGKTVGEVFPTATDEEKKTFIDTYPKVSGRFDVRNDELVTNYNNLVYDVKVDAEGKKIPVKVRAVIRDPQDGSTRLVYSTDVEGKNVSVSEKIPKREFYSKVIRPIAINNPEYDINTLDRIAQDEYNLIEGSGGQIDLPQRGPKAENTIGGKWGAKASANKYN